MSTSAFPSLRTSCVLVLGAALVVPFFNAAPTSANSTIRNAWTNFYGPIPSNANCQLCHFDTQPPSWNGYGWDIRLAIGDSNCDGTDGTMPDGNVSLDEAFACIEGLDSDMDPGANDNIAEINASTQPGWTAADTNTIFSDLGDVFNQPPFPGLEPYDPSGTGGVGGMGGTGGVGGTGGTGGTGGVGGTGGTGGVDCDPGHDGIPPGQFKRGTIVVKPGQSIQEAIDRAQPGTRIFVHGGVYEEPCNTTNGLNITKSGIHLVGQSNKNKRVILRSASGQRNGIAIVAPEVPAAAQPLGREVEHTDCMGCHTDMAPPFPLFPDVPIVDPTDDPWLYDIVVESITIEGFANNGIFTRHVDGFVFDDVTSINNRNYGIFPVLSKNGVVRDSYSTGSDLDSALWVETSEHVLVINNIVENSVNGIEVSNSDDILVMNNEMRNNTVGAAILLLPDIFDDEGRKSAKRIDLVNNWIHDNNKENTARPGSILSLIPKGIGILYLGVDDSLIQGNLVENHGYVGIAIADYCAVTDGFENFNCAADADISIEFLYDQTSNRNRVESNVLVNNSGNPPPPPFGLFAADLTLLTVPWDVTALGIPIPPFPPQDPDDLTPFHGNCYENNDPDDASFFSLFYLILAMDPTLPDPPPLPWQPPTCD